MLDYLHPVSQLTLLPLFTSVLRGYHNCQNLEARLSGYFPAHPRSGKRLVRGSNHAFYLVEGGILYGIGSNGVGQLGDHGEARDWRRIVTPELVAAVTASEHHSVLLTVTGKMYVTGDWIGLYCWDHRATHENWTLIATPVPLIAIATSEAHSFALGENGLLYQSAVGGLQISPLSTPIATLVTGDLHYLAVTCHQELYGMGSTLHDRMGNQGSKEWWSKEWFPISVTPSRVVGLDAGYQNSLLLDDTNTLYITGCSRQDWEVVPTPTPVASISLGHDISLFFISETDELYGMGDNTGEQLRVGGDNFYNTWVPLLPGRKVVEVLDRWPSVVYLTANQGIISQGSQKVLDTTKFMTTTVRHFSSTYLDCITIDRVRQYLC